MSYIPHEMSYNPCKIRLIAWKTWGCRRVARASDRRVAGGVVWGWGGANNFWGGKNVFGR